MNAVVKNKSEAELLKLIFEISSLLDIELDVEFEALKEGGIKDIIKFFKKKKNKKKIDKYLIYFGAILSGVLINVLSETINNDSELNELKKEEIRLNIQKLKKDLEEDSKTEDEETVIVENLVLNVSQVYKVQIFKSRFYSNLIKEPKVYQISTTEIDENQNPKSDEKILERQYFNKQILETEDQTPITIDDANIEIVSPVFKQSNLKWKGIYDGKPMSFQLMDSDFKNSVLNRQYSFTSGTSIRCRLVITKSLSEEGEEVIKDAKVFDVIEVFDGQQTLVTKKAKHLKELKNQIKIDFKE
jgi:hypothetical protein